MLFDARLAWLETEITASHLALDNVQSEAATNALLAQGIGLFAPEVEIARAAQIADVKGKSLPKTPAFTANIALTHDASTSLADFRTSLSLTHRGGFSHRVFNNPTTDTVRAYTTLDMLMRITPNQSAFYIDLIGKNLTSKDGVNARFTDVFGVGATGDQFIPPRQFMLRVGMDF